VENGNFAIASHEDGALINESAWREVLQPGMGVDMSVVLRRSTTDGAEHACPACNKENPAANGHTQRGGISWCVDHLSRGPLYAYLLLSCYCGAWFQTSDEIALDISEEVEEHDDPELYNVEENPIVGPAATRTQPCHQENELQFLCRIMLWTDTRKAKVGAFCRECLIRANNQTSLLNHRRSKFRLSTHWQLLTMQDTGNPTATTVPLKMATVCTVHGHPFPHDSKDCQDTPRQRLSPLTPAYNDLPRSLSPDQTRQGSTSYGSISRVSSGLSLFAAPFLTIVSPRRPVKFPPTLARRDMSTVSYLIDFNRKSAPYVSSSPSSSGTVSYKSRRASEVTYQVPPPYVSDTHTCTNCYPSHCRNAASAAPMSSMHH
jgi:hypothetical protein